MRRSQRTNERTTVSLNVVAEYLYPLAVVAATAAAAAYKLELEEHARKAARERSHFDQRASEMDAAQGAEVGKLTEAIRTLTLQAQRDSREYARQIAVTAAEKDQVIGELEAKLQKLEQAKHEEGTALRRAVERLKSSQARARLPFPAQNEGG